MKGFKRNKNKLIIISMLILCSICGTIYYNASKEEVISARVSSVRVGDISSYLNTTGVIKSSNEKVYYSPQLILKKINFKVGDKIKKGDILLEYDKSEVEIGVKQAEIQYSNALAQRNDAIDKEKISIEAIDELQQKIEEIDQKIIVEKERLSGNKIIMALNGEGESNLKELITQRQELELKKEGVPNISENIIKMAEEKLEMAKGALDIAKLRNESIKGKIISESSGVITAINVQQGAFGNPSMPAIVVQELDKLKIVISLGKNDSGNIRNNQVMNIKYGNRIYNGEVSFISPVASKADFKDIDTTLTVEGKINNVDDKLKIGFNTDVSILLDERSGVKVIPCEALKYERGGKFSVFTVDEQGYVNSKSVNVGIQSETLVEILEGLEVGEKVILNPTSNVADGIKIKVQQ